MQTPLLPLRTQPTHTNHLLSTNFSPPLLQPQRAASPLVPPSLLEHQQPQSIRAANEARHCLPCALPHWQQLQERVFKSITLASQLVATANSRALKHQGERRLISNRRGEKRTGRLTNRGLGKGQADFQQHRLRRD